MSRSPTRAEWERQPIDPDLRADLGYDPIELDVFYADVNDERRLLVLPADRQFLESEAFVVATPESVCDLETRR